MHGNELALVLTGTIIPNAPFTAHADPQTRRREYLAALEFYRQFAPVYFLENSGYALHNDAEFAALPGVELRAQPLSSAAERGKGYQEFEMLDGWLAREAQPPARWVKITGRYFFRNFGRLWANCQRARNADLLIDRCARSHWARSYLFCITTDFYRRQLAGIYRECDDTQGDYIERVLYRRLAALPEARVRLFASEPRLTGVSGTTAESIETDARRYVVKRILRKLNYALDRRQLWYTT